MMMMMMEEEESERGRGRGSIRCYVMEERVEGESSDVESLVGM